MNKYHKTSFTASEIRDLEKKYHDHKKDKGKKRTLIPVDIGKEILKGKHYLVKEMLDCTPNKDMHSLIGAIVEVLAFGAEKYKENSWQNVPDAQQRYYDAWFRHAILSDSMTIDKESGLHHWKHACCNLLFLLYFELQSENNEPYFVYTGGKECTC